MFFPPNHLQKMSFSHWDKDVCYLDDLKFSSCEVALNWKNGQDFKQILLSVSKVSDEGELNNSNKGYGSLVGCFVFLATML